MSVIDIGEYKFALFDQGKGQAAVYITIVVGQSEESYHWLVEDVIEVSGFQSPKDAADSAWNFLDSITKSLVCVGLPPSSDRVCAIAGAIARLMN